MKLYNYTSSKSLMVKITPEKYSELRLAVAELNRLFQPKEIFPTVGREESAERLVEKVIELTN